MARRIRPAGRTAHPWLLPLGDQPPALDSFPAWRIPPTGPTNKPPPFFSLHTPNHVVSFAGAELVAGVGAAPLGRTAVFVWISHTAHFELRVPTQIGKAFMEPVNETGPASGNPQPPAPFSAPELLAVATAQRAVLLLFLAVLVVGLVLGIALRAVPPGAATSLRSLFDAVAAVLFLIFMHGLAKATRSRHPWLVAVAALIPFVGLVVLLLSSSKAIKILRSNGVPVGFLGANGRSIRDLRAKAEPSRQG